MADLSLTAPLALGLNLDATPPATAGVGTTAPLALGLLLGDAVTGSHTLTADAGSFSLSGQSVALLRGFVLSATSGSFSFTGQDATLLYGSLNTAGIAITAPLVLGLLLGESGVTNYTLTAEPGAFLLTGSTSLALRTFAVDAGTFTFSGQNASFSRDYRLACESGGFSLSGQNASLRYSGEPEVATTGVPGKPNRPRVSRYVVYIDGKAYYGEEDEIRQVIESLAHESAEKAVTTSKKQRKPAIVVKAGKSVAKSVPVQEQRQEQRQVQAQVRDMYAEAYQAAMIQQLAQQADDEEAMLLLY